MLQHGLVSRPAASKVHGSTCTAGLVRVLAAVAFLLVPALAGCAAPGTDPNVDPTQVASGLPTLVLRNQTAAPATTLAWQGQTLSYEPQDDTGAPRCSAENCEVTWVRVHAPALGAPQPTQLRVMATWPIDGRQGDFDLSFPSFAVRVTTPDGQVKDGYRGLYGTLLVLEDPPAGDYRIEVTVGHEHRGGTTPLGYVGRETPTPIRAAYTGAVRIDAKPVAAAGAHPVLPDIAITAMQDFRIEYGQPVQGIVPDGIAVGASPAPWTKGCGIDESLDQAATRCLRASVALGNLGLGKLLLLFEGTSEVQQNVQQCVERSDGSFELRDAGTGAWHGSHNHHHHDDVVQFTLYEHDLATATRGEIVAQGEKFGWGFYPLGFVPDAVPATEDHLWDCSADATTTWRYGLQPGWWDAYLWWRNGNFVDIAGVPDGVYEFEAAANPLDEIHEDDQAPNTASVILRLQGDSVEVLHPFTPDFGGRLDRRP